MPFHFPSTPLYKGEYYRVCHSLEEFSALTQSGWSEEPSEIHSEAHKPLSAAFIPKPVVVVPVPEPEHPHANVLIPSAKPPKGFDHPLAMHDEPKKK